MGRYHQKRFCQQHLTLINGLNDDAFTEKVEKLGGYTALVKAFCRGRPMESTVFPHLSRPLPAPPVEILGTNVTTVSEVQFAALAQSVKVTAIGEPQGSLSGTDGLSS